METLGRKPNSAYTETACLLQHQTIEVPIAYTISPRGKVRIGLVQPSTPMAPVAWAERPRPELELRK